MACDLTMERSKQIATRWISQFIYTNWVLVDITRPLSERLRSVNNGSVTGYWAFVESIWLFVDIKKAFKGPYWQIFDGPRLGFDKATTG